MDNSTDIINLLNKSSVSLIGFSYKYEREVHGLLSNFNYKNINEFNSLKTIIRELRISSILDNEETEFIVINIGDMKLSESHTSMAKTIRDKVSDIINDNLRGKIKVIITTPINIDISNYASNQPVYNLHSNTLTYISDVVMIFDSKIKIIKNRFLDINKKEPIYIDY